MEYKEKRTPNIVESNEWEHYPRGKRLLIENSMKDKLYHMHFGYTREWKG